MENYKILKQYGWNEFLENEYKSIKQNNQIPARIISFGREPYIIQTEYGDFFARKSGKFINKLLEENETLTIGDWILVEKNQDSSDYRIEELLKRKSCLTKLSSGRKTEKSNIASNIDYVFIVNALDADFSIARIERYLTIIWESGAIPIVILNKIDKCDDYQSFVEKVQEIDNFLNIIPVSAKDNIGIDSLNKYLKPCTTSVLVGSSGVGKSSLINLLLGNELQKTKNIRETDDKGRHTTTNKKIFLLDGGACIIDTPGLREVGIWTNEDQTLNNSFDDIENLAQHCKFSDCKHENEPQCAVLKAVKEGIITEKRLKNYHKLKKEIDYLQSQQSALAKINAEKKWKNISKINKRNRRLEGFK